MRLRPILFFLLFFFYINLINAQIPVVEWQKCYGGNNDDVAKCVQLTSDGGYIVIGYTSSHEGDVIGYHGIGNGGDAWVLKMDKSGNIQWRKCLGGTDSEQGAYIVPTPDGGYVLTSSSGSQNCYLTGNHGAYDYWVVKLDRNGNILWQKMFGGSDSDIPVAIAIASGGGYFVTGYTKSTDGDVQGNHGATDCWIIKIDLSGNLIWQKCIGGSDYDIATGIQATADGGCVSIGEPGPDIPGNHGSGDYWVVKLDKLGNLQWQKCYGGLFSDFAQSIGVSSDGGYIVAGTSNSFDGDVSGNHGDGFDACIIKLDNAGNIQWQKCYGGTANEEAYDIQLTADGGYVVACTAFSSDGDLSCNAGSADAWVFKIKSNSDLEWQKSFGGNDFDGANSVRQLSDGSFIIAGYVNSSNIAGYHPTTATYPIGNDDYWVVKLSAPIVSTPNPIVTIDPSYAKVCAGGLSTIKATVLYGGLNPTYQWTRNGLPAGTNNATYSALNFENNDQVKCVVTTDGPTCDNLLLQGSGVATLKINTSVISPTINISADKTFTCNCATITIKATVLNAGTSPVYEWRVNGKNTGINTPVFMTNELNSGDLITCAYSDSASCIMNAPVVSDSIKLEIFNGGPPAVSISSSAESICSGSPVTFNATAINTGATPLYQWKVNGLNVGLNSKSYIDSIISNGDKITCSITVDPQYVCTNILNANSNTIVMAVSNKVTPSVNIETSVTTICQGAIAAFKATASNAGRNIKYQWKINGKNTGTDAAIFSTSALNNGDYVSCTIAVDPVFTCIFASNAISNSITLTVNNTTPPSISIAADHNDICAGNRITFSADAKNAGQTASYQWMLNNVAVGNNLSIFSSSSFNNGDALYCVLSPGIGSCSPALDSSNAIITIINPLPVITGFSPKDTTIKTGDQVHFTSIVSTDVTAYTWIPADKLNNPFLLNPVSVPLLQNTNFILKVVSDKGCESSAEGIIKVGIPLMMPSAFTPNNDGLNDVFRIPPGVLLQLKEFSIFDRWGNMVFKTHNINTGWNGTLNGESLSSGSYIYIIKGEDSKGMVFKKGSILLMK